MSEEKHRRFRRLNREMYEAYRNGEINKEITKAEEMGYHYFAGNRARENGLYKRAYDNFKKDGEIPEDFLRVIKTNKIVTSEEINIYRDLRNVNEMEERLKTFENSQGDETLNEKDYGYLPTLITISN